MDIDEAELKPCPFCGASAYIEQGKSEPCQMHGDRSATFRVVAMHTDSKFSNESNAKRRECHVRPTITRSSREDVIEAWNTRAQQPAQHNSIYNCPIHNCVHMSDSECPGSREQPNDAVERVYVDTAFIDAAVKYKYENGALLNVAKAAISAMPVQPSQAKIEAMENTINLYAMRIEELEKMRLPEENEAVKIMLKRAVYDSGGHKVSNAAGDVLISAKHPINLTSIYRALLAKQGEK